MRDEALRERQMRGRHIRVDGICLPMRRRMDGAALSGSSPVRIASRVWKVETRNVYERLEILRRSPYVVDVTLDTRSCQKIQ